MNIFDLADPEFIGTLSSDEFWYGGEVNICLTDVIDHKSDYDHTHTDYASSTHSHDNYATATALNTLESELDGKANTSHTHSEYATSSHTHNEYATTTALSEVSTIVSGKANASHSHILADLGIQCGRANVNCTANTVSSANVTFEKTYASAPVITLTAGSSAPGTAVTEVTVSNVTTTGFTVNVYRTNTSITTIQWIAIGSVV